MTNTITPLLSLPVPFVGNFDSPLAQLSKRLTGFICRKETFFLSNPDKTGPWSNYAEFRASLIKEIRDVRVYNVEGHDIKFVIDETFAKQLDEVRLLRLELHVPEKSKSAREQLAAHPHGQRALPEDFLQHIDELPDSSYFKDFWLLDYANPEDAWQAQVYSSPNFKSSAAADASGDVISFARDVDDFLRLDIFHEWCHHLEGHYERESKSFRATIMLEQRVPGWFAPSSYALRTFGEHWAVYGEKCMLEASADIFNEKLLVSAPRAVFFMRALKKCLTAARRKSLVLDELLARCAKTEESALPTAREFAKAFLKSEKLEEVKDATIVLDFLNNPES